MDVRTNREGSKASSSDGRGEPRDAGRSRFDGLRTVEVWKRPPVIEEASFLVIESGRIGFFVRPRSSVRWPTSLGGVQRLMLALAPRNRRLVRLFCVAGRRMPDARGRDQEWTHVDRVGAEAHGSWQLAPRRPGTRGHAARVRGGLIELACGTYAIALHRDHAHLMYELEDVADGSTELARQLRIVTRASYVGLVHSPEARWHGHEVDGLSEPGARRFLPLDPVLLDHATRLVLRNPASAMRGQLK